MSNRGGRVPSQVKNRLKTKKYIPVRISRFDASNENFLAKVALPGHTQTVPLNLRQVQLSDDQSKATTTFMHTELQAINASCRINSDNSRKVR